MFFGGFFALKAAVCPSLDREGIHALPSAGKGHTGPLAATRHACHARHANVMRVDLAKLAKRARRTACIAR